MPIQLCLMVPLAEAELVRQSLVDLEAFNAHFVPIRIGDRLALPIHDGIDLDGLEVIYGEEYIELKPAPPPINPHHRMRETMQSMIGFEDELLPKIPKKWERLSDLVLFQKESFQGEKWDQVIAQNDDFFQRVADSLNVKRIGRQNRFRTT